MTLILAGLGVGSIGMSRWIQSHKLLFFSAALSMMTLSLLSGIREKKVRQTNTGLIAFAFAMAVTAFLLSYNKIKYGYLI